MKKTDTTQKATQAKPVAANILIKSEMIPLKQPPLHKNNEKSELPLKTDIKDQRYETIILKKEIKYLARDIVAVIVAKWSNIDTSKR